jgi:hypothetical protein
MRIGESFDERQGTEIQRLKVWSLVGIIGDEALKVTDAGVELNGELTAGFQLVFVLGETIETAFELDALHQGGGALQGELNFLGMLNPFAG